MKSRAAFLSSSVHYWRPGANIVFLLGCFLLFAISQQIAYSKNPTTLPDSLQEQITAIPLIEIPQKAVAITTEIQTEIERNLKPMLLNDVQGVIDSTLNEVNALSEVSDKLVEENLPYNFYQSLSLRWSRIKSKIEKPEDALKEYSSDLSEIDKMLKSRKMIWSRTVIESLDEDSPADLLDRVKQVISQIDSVNLLLEDSINLSLNLLNSIAEIKLTCENYSQRMDATQKIQFRELLKIRTEPIWAIKFFSDSTAVFDLNKELITFGKENGREYLSTNRLVFIRLGIVFLFLLFIIYWLGRQRKHVVNTSESEQNVGLYLVSRPFATALMLSMLWAMKFLPEIPYFLSKVIYFVYLVPFLFIFHGIVKRPLDWSFYYFAVLFFFVNFLPLFNIGNSTNRLSLIVESLLIGAFLIWYLKNSDRFKPTNNASRVWCNFLRLISPVFLLAIAAGIILNIVGFENMNRIVAYGVLVSLLGALIFGTAYFAIRGMLVLFLDTKLAGLSNLLPTKKANLIQIYDKLGWLITVLSWMYLSLKHFLLWEPLVDWLVEIWSMEFAFGEIVVTVGSIITFFVIIIFSWFVSMMVKLILQEEILARFTMPRGVPMAISSLTQYTLVATGVILALGFLGFDLQNLGILAGALGVGIGFGLQNLVGNFISGLILVFERPVTAGDLVRLDEYDGTVVRIGIRASVILQWDGSRIIVPNSELVSKKVLNWSMEEYKRRFSVTINTPPETDPDFVMDLMKEAILGVEGVLEIPEPRVYFKGIEDQSLKFKLLYWVAGNILVMQSDANLAVQRMLRQAGVEILLPRLEIQETAKTEKEHTHKGA